MAGIRYKGQIFSGAASFGDADHVAYDNTESGLEATDVQDALDEVSNAEGVSYDNTQSGLTATDVQSAVDELMSSKADNNVSGPGYCKMPDGTLIQWGYLILEASGEMSQIASSGIYQSPTFTVRLPVAFKDLDYIATGIGKYSTGHNVPIGAWSSGADTCAMIVYDFYKRSLNDGLYKVRWQAVGRWK